MKFFKTKLEPEELKTKMMMAEKRLEKGEKQLRDKADKSKGEAKKALKEGDERGYRVASRRHGMVHVQGEMAANMREIAMSMRDALEIQEGLKDIVAIGSELKEYQDKLGLDSKELEMAVTNIRTSMEKVSGASDMLSQTMETISSGSVEATEAQESLRKELMAEIETEKVEEEELEKKIKEEE